jgi:hypothetical protein
VANNSERFMAWPAPYSLAALGGAYSRLSRFRQEEFNSQRMEQANSTAAR